MKFGTFRSAVVVATASFMSLAAAAQTSGAPSSGNQPPAGQSGQRLDLPQNLTFMGRPQETNVARATAIVNEEIITRSDIDHRVALFLAAQKVELPAEEMERLRAQVLRNLIDEALQIQAAREAKIELEKGEVDRYYARFAQNFGHTAQSFSDYLKSIGSSERSVKRQIQGELSWQELQQRRMNRVSVAREEVQERLDRLNAARGTNEFRVAEIYLQSAPENAAQIRARAAQIVDQLRRGASFPAYARQFSQASTAAVGGDLGWVRGEQLPPEIAAVVQAMPIQAISDPIQVPGGFSIVALVDSRQVLGTDPRDAVLSLMQMSIEFPAGTPEATVRQRAEQLATATRSMGGCGGAPEVATRIGADLVENDELKVRDLPAQVQQLLLPLNVGEPTTVIGSLERISVLVLCGRDDPKPVAAPTFASISARLEEERMNRQAQRLLRDLRRDAVIDYR